jgi:hypothetical protein
MTEQHENLERLANSALLKVMQYVITFLALPTIAWSINAVLTRLADIESSLARQSTLQATYELRMQHVEARSVDNGLEVRRLHERITAAEYEIRRVDERSARP